jgi:hypothetical protein
MEEKLVNFVYMIIPLIALFLNIMLLLQKYRHSEAWEYHIFCYQIYMLR